MSQHSILPPSSADKWMVCTDWKRATEGLTSTSSPYAIEGTEAHELLLISLRLEIPPEEIKHKTNDKDTDAMAEAVGHMVDWVNAYIAKNPDTKILVERRLYWGRKLGYPKLSGTADIALYNPRELVILDYKHGMLIIDPSTSKQIRLYLLGLIERVGTRKRYRLIIGQPRGRHIEGPIREYKISPAELEEFRKEAQQAVKENLTGTGTRKAGEHCRFCVAAPKCRTLTEFSLRLAVEEFSD